MIKLHNVNAKLLEAHYAVRGKIVIRAQELEAQGKKIIYCNIGNPQALKQKPLTFVRQVLSLLENPALLDRPETAKIYPADAIARAKMVLEKNPSGTGAYTQSAGIPFIRKAVAELQSGEKTRRVLDYCIEINRLENTGDHARDIALSKLFEGQPDPIEVIKWKEIYETLENAIDRCEDVANVMEGIVLKNA